MVTTQMADLPAVAAVTAADVAVVHVLLADMDWSAAVVENLKVAVRVVAAVAAVTW